MQQYNKVIKELNEVLSLITSLSENVHFHAMDSTAKSNFKAELIDKVSLLLNVAVNLPLHDECYQSPQEKKRKLNSKKYINYGFNDEDFHVIEPINDTEPTYLLFELLAAEKEAKLIKKTEETKKKSIKTKKSIKISNTKLKQTQQDIDNHNLLKKKAIRILVHDDDTEDDISYEHKQDEEEEEEEDIDLIK